MADLSERAGFEFADPGAQFYEDLRQSANAGIINFSNPLDMGDIYDPYMHAHIFHAVLDNDRVDGAVYVSQRPRMPREDDIFYRFFHTDISKETIGAIRSSCKPLAVCLYGPATTITKIKHNLPIPIFDGPEEMIAALKLQGDFHRHKAAPGFASRRPEPLQEKHLEKWVRAHDGVVTHEAMALLSGGGIPVPSSVLAADIETAVQSARHIGYPVALKVVSADAVHKSDAGGIVLGVRNDQGVARAFGQIRSNLESYNSDAVFEGVQIMAMAPDGYDMFVGGIVDEAFGPVVFFGYGGIHVEVFRDIQSVLCPSNRREIDVKIKRLKAFKILRGMRGRPPADLSALVDVIERVTHLMALFPAIRELDINPVRVLAQGAGASALDVRVRLENRPR